MPCYTVMLCVVRNGCEMCSLSKKHDGNQRAITEQRVVQGFTLIEMAIVLVVIGLIAAGVTIGKDIITAAQIRNLVSESGQYRNAIRTFSEIYGQLPGDFDQARSFWPNNSEYSGFVTSNGNNDRKIGYAGAGGTLEGVEDVRLWQHLNASDVIPGEFTGTRVDGGALVPTVNIPQAGWENAGFWVSYFTAYGRESNVIHFASPGGVRLEGVILVPQLAWQVDEKADDGVPSTGQTWTTRGNPYQNTPGRCVSQPSSVSLTTQVAYEIGDESISCILHFAL